MSIKRLSFTDVVRIEQLRHIEITQKERLSFASIKDMPASHAGEFNYAHFLKRLNDRANLLVRDNHLQDALQQPQQHFVYAQRVCLLLALILGGGCRSGGK